MGFQSYYKDLDIKKFINYLDSKGIETRPIISETFEPAAIPTTKKKKLSKHPGSSRTWFLIGLHTKKLMKISQN